jgi:hypothetical protein
MLGEHERIAGITRAQSANYLHNATVFSRVDLHVPHLTHALMLAADNRLFPYLCSFTFKIPQSGVHPFLR